ncbi:uncharacterized protein [Rutidosis leptorrhynchoides]|uniref:uncharacterized protein n=1 Tax=Rutidosis leptorrhynchoides TaxID=125765 RepID=UPI003A99B74F
MVYAVTSNKLCLRLQGKLCVAEIGNLLKNVQIRNLEVNGLQLKEQGNLESLDFVDCDLPSIYINTICNSLKMNVIKTFSIKRSSLFYTGVGLSGFVPLPHYLESFLMSSRSLTTLIFSNNNKDLYYTSVRLMLETLLEAESGLQVLDLSGNNVCLFLSYFRYDSGNFIYPSNKRQISLRVLNLRATDLQEYDINNLSHSMIHMPYIKVLNLSDNDMLQDKGIEMLIPYLVEKSISYTPLAELYLENCRMSHNGARKLFTALSTLRAPLKFLSIAKNRLCLENSEFGKYLGEFLCSGIQAIDVREVGLGSCGFQGAEREIHGELSLGRYYDKGSTL